jgi:serine phosphatase RsbU (regulator of sigma subunit)
VTHLNQFLCLRVASDKFITLWVGIFDPQAQTLEYIDAGHGYAVLSSGDGPPQLLNSGENLPLGVAADPEYHSVQLQLPPSANLMIVSGGIIEQPAAEDTSASREQFGIERVMHLASQTKSLSELLDDTFARLESHAGTRSLNDDATVMLVKW